MLNQIHYSIERLSPHLFGVAVPDDYDRAMLFMRPQEFVESPSDKFRGKYWDVWTFVKWYSKHRNTVDSTFSYAKDYNGFNFSLKDALRCYLQLPYEYVSGYDMAFMQVLREILALVRSDEDIDKTYIIGYDKPNSSVMKHELRHAAFFLDKAYRAASREAIRDIDHTVLKRLFRNLHDMGYHKSVMPSELQAYLATEDWVDEDLGKGIGKKKMRQLHQKLSARLKEPLKQFSKTLFI